MWSGVVTVVDMVLGQTTSALMSFKARTIEFLLIWQYGNHVEGLRRKRFHQRQQLVRCASVAADSSRAARSDEAEMDHRQAVAGLMLLAQRVPNLMGGYSRQTLQSFYGKPFTTLAEAKQRREKITDNVWLYRFKARSSTTSGLASGATHVGAAPRLGLRMTSAHEQYPVEDIPLLVWLVMPWESEISVALRFVLRLAHSLGCDALLVTVPIDAAGGASETVHVIFEMMESGRRRTHARRVLIGGSDLGAMFVLLLLERRYPLLHVGAYAAANTEVARRAFCQGVILVDPFVGWDTTVPLRQFAVGTSPSHETGGDFGIRGAPQPQVAASPSAKDRFKRLVINSSDGSIQQWFPSPITYDPPPIVVLVDKDGFWLQEQCDFNARVERLGVEENEERVFFLPYTIETRAAGALLSLSCRIELERLWRTVENFFSEILSREELSAVSTPSTDGRYFCGEDGGARSYLCEGEVTFRAAFAP
ncbi:hypothetical protein TraAM80_06005 [Trypanosoma rangeli]|uniref:Uncharacterized protein n=1 Tax=Trypanosoma rangeli TaxID=5698 RepID=A0A3R7RIB4_TRYRA|nr:uncharacterized protein TraAM80_06005 [Trypanosoma rangeli]RNF03147.1 hypothetical protein TraAM80_06005 [Trypanosoma rangeli]|eukprot:RNF03147.1 hypothetical protein TraAM80_06005 [Trypanosoma rangeli]